MTRLEEELRKDPAATFDFSCELPSGNVMHGTVGPLIGGRLVASVAFERQPHSEKDAADAQYVLACLLGCPPTDALTVRSAEEYSRRAREFLGGGQG